MLKSYCCCRTDVPEPEYRTIVWATAAALRLASRRVLTNADTKKLFLQSLVTLMSTPHAKHTDPALLMEYLLMVKKWLLEPQNGGELVVQCSFRLLEDSLRRSAPSLEPAGCLPAAHHSDGLSMTHFCGACLHAVLQAAATAHR